MGPLPNLVCLAVALTLCGCGAAPSRRRADDSGPTAHVELPQTGETFTALLRVEGRFDEHELPALRARATIFVTGRHRHEAALRACVSLAGAEGFDDVALIIDAAGQVRRVHSLCGDRGLDELVSSRIVRGLLATGPFFEAGSPGAEGLLASVLDESTGPATFTYAPSDPFGRGPIEARGRAHLELTADLGEHRFSGEVSARIHQAMSRRSILLRRATIELRGMVEARGAARPRTGPLELRIDTRIRRAESVEAAPAACDVSVR